uniref:Uncharacterized protein n=1 Tax=viral metagenome TaxID=1070528 RepID=A0A6C0DZV4_9ZZZZ
MCHIKYYNHLFKLIKNFYNNIFNNTNTILNYSL